MLLNLDFLHYFAFSVSLLAVVVVTCVCHVVAEESAQHGTPSRQEHYTDGEHNPEFDHEAVIGNVRLKLGCFVLITNAQLNTDLHKILYSYLGKNICDNVYFCYPLTI